MNAKELAEWLEERGELVITKADGCNFTVMARDANGVLRTAEAATLAEAVALREAV